MRVVVTGANRGIGLELVRQYLARGARVHAGARSPSDATELASMATSAAGNLHIGACDVTSDASVRAFAAAVTEPIGVLVNNAGVRLRKDENDLAAFDLEDAMRLFDANALGALRVTRAFLPLFARGAKIVNLSSALGSITNNDSGGGYAYRMSKAALDMASRSMARDLRDRGILVVVVSPGWVKTHMGGSEAPVTVGDSVAGILHVIDALVPDTSGEFVDFRGHRIPW